MAGKRTVKISENEFSRLSFKQANRHLLQNRLLGILVNRPWIAKTLFIATAISGLIYIPVFDVLLGALFSYILLIALYAGWQWWFMHRNQTFKVLCPACGDRMGEFSCAFCGELVPPLAFFLGGALLSHCPHCRLEISSSANTLLAHCPSGHTAEKPGRLYRKPTFNTVWVVENLPEMRSPARGWKKVDTHDKNKSVFYYENDTAKYDNHSASFLYFLSAQYLLKHDLPLEQRIIDQTRLLLISKEVAENYGNLKDRIKGRFDSSYTEMREV